MSTAKEEVLFELDHEYFKIDVKEEDDTDETYCYETLLVYVIQDDHIKIHFPIFLRSCLDPIMNDHSKRKKDKIWTKSLITSQYLVDDFVKRKKNTIKLHKIIELIREIRNGDCYYQLQIDQKDKLMLIRLSEETVKTVFSKLKQLFKEKDNNAIYWEGDKCPYWNGD